MRNRISRFSVIVRKINFMINKEYHLSNTARIVLAVLFILLGIAWVVFMMIAVSPSEKDVGSLFVITSFGTVPIVIGIMIFLSDIFDKAY